MDVVNFPGIIANFGLLTEPQINLANDLLLIGKKVGNQRDGSQYEEMAMTVQEFANLVAIAGGNETLQQTLVLGNTTGGNDVVFSAGDTAVFNSGAFTGTLSRLALSGNRTWNLPNQSGTIALLSDIPVSSNTIYTADDTITDITRRVQIRTNLIFNHGAAGVNGYLQLSSGGYMRNQTSIVTNFLEYNNVNGILLVESDTHSVTGFRANNTGGVNPTGMVEMVAGSNSTAYINIGATTASMTFYANNIGVNAGSYNAIGDWGFGTNPSAGARVTIHSASGQGFGTIISTSNLSPAESVLQVRLASSASAINVSATGRTSIGPELWVGNNTGSISVGSPLAVKGDDSSFATRTFGFWNFADTQLFQMQNDGSMGINGAPLASTRILITAGTNRSHLLFTPVTAASASGITPSDGMLTYVSNTDGTFTSVGFWGREAGVWVKL